MEVGGSSPISRLSCPFVTLVLNSGPFPPPALPGFVGTTEPVRHPGRPGLSLAGVRLEVTRLHRSGFPVLRRISSADMPSPIPRWDRWFESLRGVVTPMFPSDGGLPRFRGGSAPTLSLSRPAQRSLALRPACSRSRLSDPFHRRLRRFRYLHRRSDCYRLERPVAGRDLHPLKIQRLSTAHVLWRFIATLPFDALDCGGTIQPSRVSEFTSRVAPDHNRGLFVGLYQGQ